MSPSFGTPLPEIKTLAGWRESGRDLSAFLSVNDFVDEDFATWALEVLPPAYSSASTIQIGEPYDHVEGLPTYTTFHRSPGKPWQYRGHCYRSTPGIA